MRKTIRRAGWVAAVSTAALLMSGCAAGAPAPAGTPTPSDAAAAKIDIPMTAITIGMQPQATLAVMRYGQDVGIFAAHNLDVTFVEIPTSDAVVASLISNTINFGTVNIVTEAAAVDKKLPIKWAATLLSGPSTPEPGNSGVYVRADSTIKTWADLNGKKIQQGCLICGTELWTRIAVDKNGGDASTLNLVVMPESDALAALSQGQVDAIAISSPLVPAANAAGFRRIGSHQEETGLGQNLVPWGVSSAWADKNLGVVQAFNAAMAELSTKANANSKTVKDQMPKYYPKQVADVAAAEKVPTFWSSCFNMKSIDTLVNGIKKYKFVTSAFSTDDLFYKGVKYEKC